METIKYKSGLRYREMIYIGGKLIKSPSFKRKSDAKKWKAQKEYEAEQYKLYGHLIITTNVQFKDFAHEWLEDVIKLQRTERTYSNYKATIKKHLNPLFGHKKLKDISLNDGNLLVKKLKNRGHNAKGVNLILGLFKTILIEARRQQLIAKNPLEDFKNLKEDTQDFKYFTKSEITQFLGATLKDPLYPLYLTAIYTGMRRGELAGLLWDRVDFVNNQIVVTRILDRTGLKDRTKSSKKRVIPLHPEVRNCLATLQREQRSLKYVFCKENGDHINVNHIYRDFKKAQQKAGLTSFIRFHDLRHTFASHYMMNGGNAFDLQKIMGHSDIKMTMRYSHFSPEHLQNSIQFMGLGLQDSEEINQNLTRMTDRLVDLKRASH